MSYIKIECDDCIKNHQIKGADLDYEQVDSEERQMGAEIAYEGNIEMQCDCGKNIEITHRYWEYPEGVENHKETEVAGADIVENRL